MQHIAQGKRRSGASSQSAASTRQGNSAVLQLQRSPWEVTSGLTTSCGVGFDVRLRRGRSLALLFAAAKRLGELSTHAPQRGVLVRSSLTAKTSVATCVSSLTPAPPGESRVLCYGGNSREPDVVPCSSPVSPPRRRTTTTTGSRKRREYVRIMVCCRFLVGCAV